MHLIQARLGPESAAASLPDDAARLFASCARPDDGVEHVVVHRDHAFRPVVGLFMACPSLAVAEERAMEVCRRAISSHDALRGVSIETLGAVLVTWPWGDQKPADPEPPGPAAGPLMPLHNPSTTNPFHPF